VTSDPNFKVTAFSQVEYLKDKVTIAQAEKYLTYGMYIVLLCSVHGLRSDMPLINEY